MTPARGRFVVVEGLDGAGTTTQAERLAAMLRTRGGHAVELTKEPTNGPLGAVLRQAIEGRVALDPVALALAFAADRADHLFNPVNGVVAALDAGRWVVSDRYVLSSLAYNRGGVVSREWVAELNARAIAPDLTVFVDVDPEICLERIGARSSADELFHSREQLVAVDRNYRDLIAAGHVHGPLATVDGSGSIDAVHDAIWTAVGEALGDS
ncbi:dTMP kinase [Conexibacter woesei]|uniref:Thymidylate kinase n=1 Tax=Conexibacter woesei (strain DSM 14684 / CCUG 47730 / CIP 108061 / JCM 11494 / NBRC 100937 / ID131577) TaxID=469383 RepID=D3FBZ7_CONWI|nr:dTMP kinase [Conexibacter woesei]ADB51412.1 thymidylate kinase [Conexibacter woesei DSM 14684]